MNDYQLKNMIFLVTNSLFIYSYYLIFKESFGCRHRKKWRDLIPYLVFYMVNSGMYIAKFPPLITFGSFCVFLFLCLVDCHPGKLQMKVMVSVIIISYSFLIEMVSGYLVATIFSEALGELLERASNEIIIIVLSKILLFLSAITLSIGKRSYHIEEKPPHYAGMLLLVPVSSVLLIICIFMGDSEKNRDIINYITLISVFLVFLLNQGVYYLIKRICIEYDHKFSIKELEHQLQLYSQNSEMQKKFIIEMEAYRHDVKNLYIRLSNYIKEGRYQEAADALQKEMGIVHNINGIIDTGNLEMDYLINYKISYASEKGVEIQWIFRIEEPVQLEVDDLYNLFGNILDNAIEAVEEMEEKVPIQLYLESSKGMLYISERNHFKGERLKTEDGFQSTKPDGKGHGYGLRRIKKITEDYDGCMKSQVKGTEFLLEVILYYRK